jgi:hypothetical protein
MKPLQNEPVSTEKVLYVFYDFETTQDTKYSEKATVNVPNLVFTKVPFTMQEYRCARLLTVWETYTFLLAGSSRGLAILSVRAAAVVNKFIAIAHNAKSFDLHFILNRAILLKWQPEIIMNGMKIMCMKFELMVFLDSVSFILFTYVNYLKRLG